MSGTTRVGVLTVALIVAGCSSSSGGGGGSGGADGGGTGGQAGAAGAAQCGAITGAYAVTATRDQTAPGSCPTSVAYADGIVATIKSESGGFVVSYPSSITQPYSLNDCTTNVSSCQVAATCKMIWLEVSAQWDSEIAWTVTDAGLSGVEQWTNYNQTNPSCSARWNVTGSRQ